MACTAGVVAPSLAASASPGHATGWTAHWWWFWHPKPAHPAHPTPAHPGHPVAPTTSPQPASPGATSTTSAPTSPIATTSTSPTSTTSTAGTTSTTTTSPTPATTTTSAPAGSTTSQPPIGSAGNPDGHASVPGEAAAVDTSHPTTVIGTGTPAGCTSAAVVAAVAKGGIVTFDCGPDPIVITLAETAKVVNTNDRLVIDGGGKVTLSGGGKHRILYQNTCDSAQVWTTTHCDDQPTPLLALQNLSFVDADSSTESLAHGQGGGAVYLQGGQLKVVNSTFARNRCDATGPDVAGGALRPVLTSTTATSYVVNSTFDGNRCSNGAAIGGLQARRLTVINSLLRNNTATGVGANPQRAGTPGGGNGGALYDDGTHLAVTVAGTLIEDNTASEGGAGLFYTSNDGTGTISISSSVLRRNPDAGWIPSTPGLFVKGLAAYGADTAVSGTQLARFVTDSTIQP